MKNEKKMAMKAEKKMIKPTAKKAAAKGKFPDSDGNGKITKKDILIARGVIPAKKK